LFEIPRFQQDNKNSEETKIEKEVGVVLRNKGNIRAPIALLQLFCRMKQIQIGQLPIIDTDDEAIFIAEHSINCTKQSIVVQAQRKVD
jgi:hypothetical protein